MPAKKTTKNQSLSDRFDIQKIMDNPDSYKNLIYGIITVVVLFVVLFLGLRTLSNNQPEVTDQAAETQESMTGKTHVVEEGETLWSIAEKEYGDGFKWEAIAQANKISNASSIEKGQRLVIPEVKTSPTASAAPSVSPTTQPTAMTTRAVTPTVMPTATAAPRPTVAVPTAEKIAGTTYKIVEGDTLWDIATRAYGDGYRWVEIASNNKIANPDLIYAGNTVNLKRP